MGDRGGIKIEIYSNYIAVAVLVKAGPMRRRAHVLMETPEVSERYHISQISDMGRGERDEDKRRGRLAGACPMRRCAHVLMDA